MRITASGQSWAFRTHRGELDPFGSIFERSRLQTRVEAPTFGGSPEFTALRELQAGRGRRIRAKSGHVRPISWLSANAVVEFGRLVCRQSARLPEHLFSATICEAALCALGILRDSWKNNAWTTLWFPLAWASPRPCRRLGPRIFRADSPVFGRLGDPPPGTPPEL